jgi:hypothetical protein
MNLAAKLKQFDDSIDEALLEPYKAIEEKSKALANSLRRCFSEARESARFEAAYKAGNENRWKDLSEEELQNKLIEPFEEVDYLIFREFVRLLRACSLHIGGNISGQIRKCYIQTFKEDRVLLAYKAGLEEAEFL